MSDYETTERRRNIIVGTFVMAALGALLWMIVKFRDLPQFASRWKSFEVKVQFPSAPGVDEETPVQFCGYEIGKVVEVKRPRILEDLNTGESYHQALVVLNIDRKFQDIPSNVDVKVMTRGLGTSYIEFSISPPDPNKPPPGLLADGSLLQGSSGMTSEFFPEESQKKLDELINGILTFVKNANEVIGDPNNKGNFSKTLANLSVATEQAMKALEKFQELSAAGTTILKNTDARTEKLVTAMLSTSDEFGMTVRQLRVILENVNSGQGTAGKLISDGRLYDSLLDNAQQLQELLGELKSFVAKARDKGLPIKLK